MAGSAGQEVVAADDLGDTLGSVVDDDGEVVRGDAVVALQDDIVDRSAEAAGDEVVDLVPLAIGAQPQCGPTTLTDAPVPLGSRQQPAGSGIRHLGHIAMRCERRPRGSRRTGAEALVDAVLAAKVGDGVEVALEALALAHDVTVGPHPERGQLGELPGLVLGGRRESVEILHAHPPVATLGAGLQPADQGCAQVADVQRACRRGGESARTWSFSPDGPGQHLADREVSSRNRRPVPQKPATPRKAHVSGTGRDNRDGLGRAGRRGGDQCRTCASAHWQWS